MKPEIISYAEIHEILPPHPVISIAGAGGKTTLMFSLAKDLPGTVVTTTTTKVGETQIRQADRQVTLDIFSPDLPGKSIWVSPSVEPQNGKIIGCGKDEFAKLSSCCGKRNLTLIAETDGAACRHIKAPAAHEPNIPSECNVCFYLAGLDVLNRPVCPEIVHRPEIFSRLTNTGAGMPITVQSFINLFEHPEGGLKNIPGNAVKIACLTHADNKERTAAAEEISRHLRHYDYVCIH